MYNVDSGIDMFNILVKTSIL